MEIIKLKPHPGPQELFLLITADKAYECMFGGTKGPGKTQMLIQESLRQIENPAYRGYLFRRTFPRLGEVIDRTHKYFRYLGATYSQRDSQIQLPAWTFPSGAKIGFGHIQNEGDKYNYQGKEMHFLGFDQIDEFTETQYLFLMAQNRSSDTSIKCYIRSTANPGGVGHGWVKRRFVDPWKRKVGGYDSGNIKFFKDIDGDDIETDSADSHALSRCFIYSTVYDNPSLIENDPAYIRRLEQLPPKDKQALLFGDWDVFAGQFFDMWRNSIHIKQKEINPHFRKFISLDYGYTAFTSVGWWQVDYDGNIHRYRELYREGLTYEQLGKEILRMTPQIGDEQEVIEYLVADPAIWGDKPHHKGSLEGESGGETLQRVLRGFCPVIPGDNNRITGWGRMRILMTPQQIHGEQVSAFTVSPECRDFIRTVPILIHDDTKKEDVDTSGEDHCADESRYAVMSRPIRSTQPKTEKQPRYTITEEDIERDINRVLEEV